MIRKYVSIILAITVLFACMLPSCSREPEEGTISDVIIDQPVPDADADTIFTKADSPYDYEYTTFTIKKAHMRFDVPKTWNVTVDNSRHIILQTPAGDGYLPDTTISILCNYGENVDENEMSQYTLNNHAFNFSDFFKDELSGLVTRTGGISRHLRKYEVEDNIYNGLEFVDSEHAEDAATLTVDDVVLVDNTNKYYIHECGMVTTYVKWDHSPFCFNSVVKQAYLENARSMIEYIVSSIVYESSDHEGYKEVEYKKEFTTCVPNSFMPLNGAENVFTSSLKENRETSGMTIGVFTLDGFSKNDVSAENINDYYSQTISKLVFGGYSDIAQFGVTVEPCYEEGGPDFTGRIFVDCTGYTENVQIAGGVFGQCAYYLCDYYIVEKGDQTFLIAAIYQDCQKEIGRAAGKTAVRKLRVK